MTPDQFFLFAAQVMDEAGAVSMGREYAREVVNFQVRADMFRPQITLHEFYLGTTMVNMQSSIAAGQPLNFSWIATAENYGGNIISYRHGYDLMDPDDPNDPGWSVPPGTQPQNMFSQERSFSAGYHTFILRVEDDSHQVNTLTWSLNVVPFVSPEYQYPLLVIDQVVDDQTNQWPGPGGFPAYDKEEYRNAYWQFLEGEGGVAGFNWSRDRFDHTQGVDYEDLVYYRSVLVFARNHSNQLLFNQFRPVNGQDRYVWLAPYQHRGGNLFLVGSQSMESFLETQQYMVPIIFDTEEEYYELYGDVYVVGFGTAEMPDGTEYQRGPRQYPYEIAGISALDWGVPLNKFIYGRPTQASSDRRSSCAGLKGLVLSQDFKTNHLIGPGVIPDTVMTNTTIDWRDHPSSSLDSLNTQFPFSGDEFVNANISSRPTPIVPQECEDGPAGLCIEPMFTGLARFDWLRQRKWADGDDGWPSSTYTATRLEEICGPLALTTLDADQGPVPNGTARTNGHAYGYLSYKNVADKPNQKADVYWGFDPYRFDHENTKRAVRWVLSYFGLEINN